jgi:hypothetical protein
VYEVHGVAKARIGPVRTAEKRWGENAAIAGYFMRQNDERIWGNLGRCRAFGVGRTVFTENNPMDETRNEGPGPGSVESPSLTRGAGGDESARGNR